MVSKEMDRALLTRVLKDAGKEEVAMILRYGQGEAASTPALNQWAPRVGTEAWPSLQHLQRPAWARPPLGFHGPRIGQERSQYAD
jgi:hypothetical protein